MRLYSKYDDKSRKTFPNKHEEDLVGMEQTKN